MSVFLKIFAKQFNYLPLDMATTNVQLCEELSNNKTNIVIFRIANVCSYGFNKRKSKLNEKWVSYSNIR